MFPLKVHNDCGLLKSSQSGDYVITVTGPFEIF